MAWLLRCGHTLARCSTTFRVHNFRWQCTPSFFFSSETSAEKNSSPKSRSRRKRRKVASPQRQDETTAEEPAAGGRRSRSRRRRRNVTEQPQTTEAESGDKRRARRKRRNIVASSEVAQETASEAAMARVSTGATATSEFTSVEDEGKTSEDENLASLIEEFESDLPEPDVNLMSRLTEKQNKVYLDNFVKGIYMKESDFPSPPQSTQQPEAQQPKKTHPMLRVGLDEDFSDDDDDDDESDDEEGDEDIASMLQQGRAGFSDFKGGVQWRSTTTPSARDIDAGLDELNMPRESARSRREHLEDDDLPQSKTKKNRLNAALETNPDVSVAHKRLNRLLEETLQDVLQSRRVMRGSRLYSKHDQEPPEIIEVRLDEEMRHCTVYWDLPLDEQGLQMMMHTGSVPDDRRRAQQVQTLLDRATKRLQMYTATRMRRRCPRMHFTRFDPEKYDLMDYPEFEVDE